MAIKVRLQTRDWDFWTPILLGDIKSSEVDLELTRVQSLNDDFALENDCEASEMSLSRYAMKRDRGDDANLIGIPFFIMRGFRNRCILTLKDSPIKKLQELKGKRIGLSGWQDSGNTWTRALLLEAGVPIDSIEWTLSRMTEHDAVDFHRADAFVDGKTIFQDPEETPLVQLLKDHKIDAIFQAFMPSGFYDKGYGLRQLQPDFVQEEISWFGRWGFVPGIHLLAMKADFVNAYPGVPRHLVNLLRASEDMWLTKRRKYFETTPWVIADLLRMSQVFAADWNPAGLEANRKMINEFAYQQFAQKLTPTQHDADFLFPNQVL